MYYMFKKLFDELQAALSEFVSTEYGPDCWVELERISAENYSDSDDISLLYVLHLRAGATKDSSMLDEDIYLPDKYSEFIESAIICRKSLDIIVSYLEGYLTSVFSKEA